MGGNGRAPAAPGDEARPVGARIRRRRPRGASGERGERMLFADIDILDENLDLRPHCWVGVKNGRIADLDGQAPADAEAARNRPSRWYR